MSFGLYALGFLIVIGGLIYGPHLMHVPAHLDRRRRYRAARNRHCHGRAKYSAERSFLTPGPVFIVVAAARFSWKDVVHVRTWCSASAPHSGYRVRWVTNLTNHAERVTGQNTSY